MCYNLGMNSLRLKQTSSLFFLFVVFFIELMAANLAHPATPTIIVTRGLPSSTFGYAFAAMALGSFLFSSFWAYLNDRIGRVRVFALGCYGYALGQLLFMFATSLWMVVVARFIAGVFVGGVMMTQLVLILDHSLNSDRALNLTVHATLFTLGGALGYFFGGILADIHINVMFIVQIVALISVGLLVHIGFKGIDVAMISDKATSINPLRFFNHVIHLKPFEFSVFCGVVFLSMVGVIAFDQIFNFYLKDQFLFPASMNGIVRAAFGILSLITNMTLGRMIIARKWFTLPFVTVLFATSILIMFFVFIQDLTYFMLLSIIFYILNSLYLILIQIYSSRMSAFAPNSATMGLYNAIRSLGMVFGSFFAGALYQWQINASFVFAAFMLGLAGLFFIFALVKNKV